MIYLDFNATSLLQPSHLEDLKSYLPSVGLGNPSSSHFFGQNAAFVLDETRRSLANLFDCSPSQIFFTSGATESNQIAIQGLRSHWEGAHILCSLFEHSSVFQQMSYLESKGARVTFFDPRGEKVWEDLLNQITHETCALFCMAANNETGWGFPVLDFASKLEQAREGAYEESRPDLSTSFWKNFQFHVDAAQVFGKIPLSLWFHPAIDSLSLSAHKVGALGGLGVLLLGEGRKRIPLFWGGGQERGLRSGTENLLSLLSFQRQLEEVDWQASFSSCREKLIEFEVFLRTFEGIQVNSKVSDLQNLPNTVHFSFRNGMSSQSFLIKGDLKGFAMSSGSACSSGLQKGSRVLKLAFPQDPERSRETIRISLDPWDDTLGESLKKLRDFLIFESGL